jgi:hypothetical protein
MISGFLGSSKGLHPTGGGARSHVGSSKAVSGEAWDGFGHGP